jgi:hypothetical protein
VYVFYILFSFEEAGGCRHTCFVRSFFSELASRHPNRWPCKEAEFKARALTTTRRAGGLDFRPPAEKTKARPCLQRYVCESKQPRGVRRTLCTPQRQRAEAQRRNWSIYEAINRHQGLLARALRVMPCFFSSA